MKTSGRAPKRRVLAVAGLVLTGLALVARAAAAQGTEPVVVLGSVAAQRLLDTPFAVGVVDAEQLRAGGPMVHLSEALARVPGLVVNLRHNEAQDLQIHSRGFGARASFGVRGMRLYADGIPAAGPDGQGQVSHFDLAGAERVEVLRGPFSALYGSSSGGVISLTSAEPAARRVGLDLDLGSQGLAQWRTTVTAPLEDGFSLRLSASDWQTDGARPHSAAQRGLGSARLAWRGEVDRVVLTMNVLDQPAQDPLGLTRAQFAADPGQTASAATSFDTRKRTRQQQTGIQWQHRVPSAAGLQQWALMAHAGERSVTQWLAIAAETQAPARHPGGVVDFERRSQGLDLRTTWRWPTASMVLGAAVDSQHESRRGFENFLGTPPDRQLGVSGRLRRDESNRLRSADLFAQAQWAPAEAWMLGAGWRRGALSLRSVDTYLANGDDSGALRFTYAMPVVSLRWQPSAAWTLYLSAGRGFETPTLNEVAYRPDGSAGFNGALRPQRSRQVEAGIKWRRQGLAVDGAWFRAASADEIAVQGNSGGRASFHNVGRTLRRGVEGSLRWQPAPGWRIEIAATLLDATYRDGFLACATLPCTAPTSPVAAGNRIAGTLARSAFAEIAWRATPSLELALEGRAQASVPVNDLNADFAAGFGLLSARLSWTLPLPSSRLETLLRLDNLADRRVAGSVIVGETSARYFEPAPGRQWLLGLRWAAPW